VLRVELISYTPEPEKICALAMRLCHFEGDLEDLEEAITPTEMERLLVKAKKLQHLSIFEHAYFTFYIDGISRVTSHQLVRHRIASYSQQSQRYVKLKGGIVIPLSIQKQENVEKIFLSNLILVSFKNFESILLSLNNHHNIM